MNQQYQPNQPPVIIAGQNKKSGGVAFLLALFFGPLGLFYASVTGGIVMLIVDVFVGIITLGFGLFFSQIVCVIWAMVAVNKYNERHNQPQAVFPNYQQPPQQQYQSNYQPPPPPPSNVQGHPQWAHRPIAENPMPPPNRPSEQVHFPKAPVPNQYQQPTPQQQGNMPYQTPHHRQPGQGVPPAKGENIVFRAMTIQCTTPSCKTSIPVPEGASYVVCPACGNWHFPSDYDNNGNLSGGMGSTGYGSPSAPPPYPIEPAKPENFPLPNEPYPVYPHQGLSNDEPDFPKSVEIEKKAVPSVGSLQLQDGRRLQLKIGQNVIGRKCGDLSINDPTVSRRHCVIEVTPSHSGGGWDYTLYDIGAIEGTASTNGVFLSGRSLRLQNYEKLPITNGATIQLGSVYLVLQNP